MPLVRKDQSLPGASVAPPTNPPAGASADARWSAARALGDVEALAEALSNEADPRVREALFTSLSRVGTEAAADAVLVHVRSDDASLRTLALDALRRMPQGVAGRLPGLLRDPDSDVRLLVAELARELPALQASAILCDLLQREDQPNVCAAAVDVLAEVGGPEALPVLARCAERFGAEPFLGFSIKVAVQRIGAQPRG